MRVTVFQSDTSMVIATTVFVDPVDSVVFYCNVGNGSVTRYCTALVGKPENLIVGIEARVRSLSQMFDFKDRNSPLIYFAKTKATWH